MFKTLIAHDQYLIAAIMLSSIWISSDDGKEWVSFNEGLVSDCTFPGLVVRDSNLWSLREGFSNTYRRPLTDLITSIYSEVKTMPSEHVLYQIYPNSFNPSTTLSYSIPNQSHVTLKIFDVLGREVFVLVNKEQPIGNYEVEFDASMLTSGVYFYRIHAGDFVETKKMVLIK